MSSREEQTHPKIEEIVEEEHDADLKQEVEELRRMNHEQAQTINLFYTLFFASPIPIYIASFEDGRILYVNNALLQYFGWERAEVVGHTGTELGFWRSTDERQHFFAQVRENGRISREDRFNSPSGSRFALCSLSYVPTADRDFVVIALVDITERVVAEARVRELAAALGQAEQRERRRVAQLLHDDVQQLLYSIQMDLQMMADDADPELREQVQELERRTLAAVEMTRSLSFELNVSAVESENLQDLFDWLTVVKNQRYGLKIDAQVSGDIQIPDKPKRQMLVQALRELLFNVVKHAGVREAELRAEVEDGDLIIDVIDRGRGVDPEAIKRKGSDPASPSSGLANVREQLDLFNGSLHIEPVSGGGTRCRIMIPL